MSRRHRHDVLIIGSGAAGLFAALHLAESAQVAVITKGELDTGSTAWAQGGVAAVSEPADSPEQHIKDTLEAGAGLCHENAVRFTVENARSVVDELVAWGVPFDQDADTGFHLTKEGGHSFRRVLHVADSTGRALSDTLIGQALKHPNIEFFTERVAIDLVTTDKLGQTENRCVGAYLYNQRKRHIEVFQAHQVILATGGASKVYLYTSNPDSSTGDGIAMAWRAGCRIANMEFNQFHPTCLYHPHAKSFLISEAVRGEGGVLILPDGERFMPRFDARAELAPRDIVARAIDHEMKRLGIDCVYLDISHLPAEQIEQHFPTIRARCLEFGIDITREPIPVVPAAHYTCGGVVVDLQGCTDIPGLYAIGETSCTGLHGANRLASNSLLECMVFGRAAAQHISSQEVSAELIPDIPDWDESQVTDSDEDVVISHNWDELRRFMWDYVGIVRTNKRLERARHRIDLLKREIHEYYSNYRVGNDLIELRNLIHVAELIVDSALRRKESRGLHYNRDYPNQLEQAHDTILTPPHRDPLDMMQPIA